jgi:hypothetical protein
VQPELHSEDELQGMRVLKASNSSQNTHYRFTTLEFIMKTSLESTDLAPAEQESSFKQFYTHTFLPEHQQPLNVALRVFGTVAGLVWLVAMPFLGLWYLVLLFPAVHAVPGLIGHRLVERSAAVGDIRVTRKDFPVWWFIVGNHLMTWDLVRGRGLR